MTAALPTADPRASGEPGGPPSGPHAGGADELRAFRARRRSALVQALGAVLPPHAMLWQDEQTRPYECDGLTAYRERPLAVALP